LLSDLQTWDLVLANLELVLSARGTPLDKRYTITLRSSPEVAQDLAPFSIGAVSLANNHTMDYGVEALQDTIDVVEARGIATFGAGATLRDAFRARVVDVRGVRVGLVGLSCTLPPGSAATDGTGGVAPIRVITQLEMDPGLTLEQPGSAPLMHTRLVDEDVDRAQAAVRSAREEADVTLVMMHWGVPPASIATFYGFYLAEYQQPLGHALIDAGADVIIGHHPHVLHAAETYRGGLIVYSLGNMAFEAPPGFMSDRALLLDLELERNGVRAARLVPLQLTPEGMPRRATPAEAAAILDELDAASRKMGTILEYGDQRQALVAVLDRSL
jgi:poly-gamma-glutamate synthesis protein (capsule biosynthesis protein)